MLMYHCSTSKTSTPVTAAEMPILSTALARRNRALRALTSKPERERLNLQKATLCFRAARLHIRNLQCGLWKLCVLTGRANDTRVALLYPLAPAFRHSFSTHSLTRDLLAQTIHGLFRVSQHTRFHLSLLYPSFLTIRAAPQHTRRSSVYASLLSIRIATFNPRRRASMDRSSFPT